MTHIIYDIIFTLISLYILIKAIAYSIYEIKQNKNKAGGICVIIFSVAVVMFADIMMYIR